MTAPKSSRPRNPGPHLKPPAFELDCGAAVKQDVLDREAKWKGGSRFASLKGRSVGLRVELTPARRDAFSGRELPPER